MTYIGSTYVCHWIKLNAQSVKSGRFLILIAWQCLRGEKRKLGENPIQLVVLHQIMAQLKAFRGHAEMLGRQDIVDIYSADISVFITVLRDKRDMDISDYSDDPVIKELYRALEARKRQ